MSLVILAILKVILRILGLTDRSSASNHKFQMLLKGSKAFADGEVVLSTFDVRGLQPQS
jgi:hypothetical protein